MEENLSHFVNYDISEDFALDILNNKHKLWKPDFKKAVGTIDFDFINSEGIKVELKSTVIKKSFEKNWFHYNAENQKKAFVIFMLLSQDFKRMIAYKFLPPKIKENN